MGPNQIRLPSTNQSVTHSNHNNTVKLSLNCCSIHSINQRAKFHGLVQEHQLDVIIGCESQIDQSYNSSEVFPKGYHVFRKGRCEGGGGVFTLSKMNLMHLRFHRWMRMLNLCGLR